MGSGIFAECTSFKTQEIHLNVILVVKVEQIFEFANSDHTHT